MVWKGIRGMLGAWEQIGDLPEVGIAGTGVERWPLFFPPLGAPISPRVGEKGL